MAASRQAPLAADRHGRLSHGRNPRRSSHKRQQGDPAPRVGIFCRNRNGHHCRAGDADTGQLSVSSKLGCNVRRASARYKTGYQFPRRRQRTASETRRMFRLAFYEGRPILKWRCSLRALHQKRQRSWLNGKNEQQHAEERRRRAVRRASLPNPCEGRQRNALVLGRRQENG